MDDHHDIGDRAATAADQLRGPIADLKVHAVDDPSTRARVVVLVLQMGQAHSFGSPTGQNLGTVLVLRF